MTENSFAFIIHPIDPKRDVSRKFPALGKLPSWLIDYLSLFFPPVYISQITGITSQATGTSLSGWFIACPLTPARMMSLPPRVVYKKVVQTGRYAEKLGAKILGLGAFTSVVGDGGISISEQLSIPVTTGDSYTVATAVQAIRRAAAMMKKEIADSTVAIVGATGAIGAVCAQMLAAESGRLLLIGRQSSQLEQVATKACAAGAQDVQTTTAIESLVKADLIISVTSAIDSVIKPQHLKSGAIVCDVARPRDVSRQVVAQRPDVLVIEGGMVKVPGAVDFGFNFGFPPQMAYACMAETMALALDNRYESFTLGKALELSQVQTIDKIAYKHGFRLGGFRSFERAVSESDIAKVRAHCRAVQPASSAPLVIRDQPAVDSLLS